MKDAQQQAQDAMQQGQGMGQQMGGGDMAAQAAESAKMQKIAQAGVEAPGVIHTIRPSGQTDLSGGQRVDFDVSIRPASGDPYQTTINQAILPAQMEGLSEGQAITVRYDPDAPTSAIIYSW
jgi:cold shock CspA family protein